VRFFEAALHLRRRARVDDEGSIRTGVTNMRADDQFDLVLGDTLSGDLAHRCLAELCARALDIPKRFRAERKLDCLLARGADIGEPHAVGRHER
jgi:hypothetical protein